MPKAIVYITLLLVGFACSNTQQEDKLIIAAAANMQFALIEIVAEFEKESGLECELIFSSSGKLTAQILEGAPYDVFISADMKYPERVFEEGLTTEAPTVYANGKLVLWTTNSQITPEISNLRDPSIQNIALANPQTAPYGKAAMEVLNSNELFESLEGKLVYGESIAQTNQFIVSQAAQVGFTAMSVMKGIEDKYEGSWREIPSEFYSPIEQGLVIISSTSQSNAFAAFMKSPVAVNILTSYGYEVK